jgi:hypothetical protein
VCKPFLTNGASPGRQVPSSPPGDRAVEGQHVFQRRVGLDMVAGRDDEPAAAPIGSIRRLTSCRICCGVARWSQPCTSTAPCSVICPAGSVEWAERS